MITAEQDVIVEHLTGIMEVKTQKSSNRKQLLYLLQKGYSNEAKNIKNEDDVFEVQLWNRSIDVFKLHEMNLVGKKAKVIIKVRGRKFLKDGEYKYETFLTLSSIKPA